MCSVGQVKFTDRWALVYIVKLDFIRWPCRESSCAGMDHLSEGEILMRLGCLENIQEQGLNSRRTQRVKIYEP